MTTEAEERQDVTVFWDLETTFASHSAKIPISTSQVVANLRADLARFGPLRSIRAYWDYAGYSDASSTTRMRSELSAAGAMLIDCPGEGRKAAAMKKMLVDMVLHAWDHPTPHTFVVITSDQDVAYCLSTLRMRYYRVILLASAGSHLDLTSQASVNLDWSRGILGLSGATLAPKEPELPLYESQGTSSIPQPSNFSTAVPPPPIQNPRSTLNGYDSGAELIDTPARGRRQPMFSKSLDANYGAFGDLGSSYMTPPPKTMSFTGFGDGPLFPRSQSFSNLKAARSGSAPPHDLPPPNPLGPFRRGSDFAFSTPPTAGLRGKGKEREFPVFEPDEIPPPRPSTKPRPSWISSTFEPFDEDDKIDKEPIKEVNAARKASVISVSSVDSLETHYSLVEPVEQQTTAPTSAEQEDPHKFVNSDKTRQYTAPGLFAEEPTSVESTHDGPPSPASTRHGHLHSRRESITSQRPAERPMSVDPLQPTQAPPPLPLTQTKILSSALAEGSSSQVPLAHAPATPRPIAPLPTRTLAATPGASTSNAQAGPSNAPATSTSRLDITELPKIWVPLIVTLRNHKGVLPYPQLPMKLLKPYPSAYSLAGKSKYGKYIDAAIVAGIVSKISTTDGPAIRVADAYA